MYELMPIIDRVKDWNALIILVMAVVIAVLYIVIRMIYPDFYRMVAYRMFVENFSGREITKPTDVSSIEALTTIISLLSISTMLFAAVCYSGLTTIGLEYGSEWKTMLKILLIFSAFNFGRGLTNLFFGFLFRIDKYAANYNTLILDTERILSFVFVPLFVFCPFVSAVTAKILIWIAFAAVVLLVGFQYVTFFFHLVKNKFLNHHSILYFCALEVLPILVVIKLAF
ncbi:MAG: DUF4271 domain-containing protein [Bacteroidales bacterium]|nr:DUF4271 domain-containing protein [Bacteroidales bacterium]MBQ1719419.1 DUF4271 domain-containing protein [Bacteroidales bacterium]MBQ2351475.1 DUF4271 domain-containing protein [Bacteroidales bacterium]MBQ4476413.1 DUF4271 domain-containing protein [Bacteroidales bacterium]